MITSGKPRYIQANGIQLAYERAGRGMPMLLIHGFPRDRRLWRKLIPLPVDRFDTVAMDRRGYGESERSPDPATYDNRTMSDDARQLVQQLGWRRCVVVGHDLGQPVAQRLAADVPEMIAGAVFLDSLPQGVRYERKDPSGRSWYFDFYRQRGVAEQIIGQNPRLFFSLFLERNKHLTAEEHQAFLEPLCRKGSVEAVLADYRHRLEDDRLYWEQWVSSSRKLEPPVCALWGSAGPIASTPVLELWRTVADNVCGAEISNSAHYVQEEQPEQVARLVRQFADTLGE